MENFVGIPDTYELWGQNFYDGGVKPVQEQVNLINSTANNCRWWYNPIFKDDSKYLPVSNDSATIVVKNPIDLIDELKSQVQPSVQSKKEDYTGLIILGLGAFVVYKLLS